MEVDKYQLHLMDGGEKFREDLFIGDEDDEKFLVSAKFEHMCFVEARKQWRDLGPGLNYWIICPNINGINKFLFQTWGDFYVKERYKDWDDYDYINNEVVVISGLMTLSYFKYGKLDFGWDLKNWSNLEPFIVRRNLTIRPTNIVVIALDIIDRCFGEANFEETVLKDGMKENYVEINLMHVRYPDSDNDITQVYGIPLREDLCDYKEMHNL